MNKRYINTFSSYLNESKYNSITLYHGTCLDNAYSLIKKGWKVDNSSYGGNMGNSNYLYLSSDKEDALWFAQEKGCNSVVIVEDIPISYLKPDPEDEAGFTLPELLDRLNNTHGLPSKFILTKELDSSHFKLLK